MSRNIEDLEYSTRVKATLAYKQMDAALKDLGYDGVYISETKRTLTVQMAYYSRGRMDPADVKRMYAAAGLYAITTEEAKVKNTWTLQSNHISGNAVDFVPLKNGKPVWDAPEEVWNEMGRIGKGCGLKWGGDWPQRDLPHFEN